jgi:uncharacterized protein involved in outer membrane biogenesis
MFRLCSILLLGLVFANFAAAAVDDVHEGKVLAAADGKITIQDKDGNSEVFTVAADAKITFDGKPAELEEVANGSRAKVTVKTAGDKKTAVIIEAKSKE